MNDAILKRLHAAREMVVTWADCFPEPTRAILAASETSAEVTRLSYIDGYWRILRTTPMILRAIERFDRAGDNEPASFWIEHLSEEAFHDRLMHNDIEQMFEGPDIAAAAIENSPITPPSAALVGYFEWQVVQGNPHLLIALRVFEEWFFSNMNEYAAAQAHSVIKGGSSVMRSHRELDGDHVKPCFDYIERNCSKMAPSIEWSLDFTGRCLRDSQIFLVQQLLRRNS